MDKSQPNPYCVEGGKSAGPSESAVLKELKETEAAEAAEGRAPLNETRSTPSSFVKAGLQVEESQRRIKAEVKGGTLVTADWGSQIQEMRNSLLKKIRMFERLQQVFMPGVETLWEAAEEARDVEQPAPKAEDIKLWLPSELTPTQRRAVCRRGVAEVEAKLRHGQCTDSLNTVHSRLHAQCHLITWRNANSVGQRQTTWSATLIGRVGDLIGRVADKYRAARTALIRLKGESHAPEFKELLAEHLKVHAAEANDSDAKSRAKLARLGTSSKQARNEPSSTGKTTFSWIWTVGGEPGEDESVVHDSVRVEWVKAKARRDRWVEEVSTLREEMKRVLRWIQADWRGRAEERMGVDAELAGGLRGYARRQMDVHRQIAEAFHKGWSRLVTTAVRDTMRQDGTVYRELLDRHAMDSALVVGLQEVEEAEDAEAGQRPEIGPVQRSSRVGGAASMSDSIA
ncbi:hypothetical protein FB451DRAFT_1292009 [Mycena latifolia]|nr:hypothetical protein FB451DRAFT_1292009 [Mycena latifolia]